MVITKLEAHQIKGFEDFSVEPKAVTIVSGPNASCKTTLLSLVTGMFGKGNPRMLRAGAESGHILGVLSDGNETWEVRREFLPGKVKTANVKSSRGGKLGAGAEFLSSIMDHVSVDPINRAMTASEDEQCRILLDTMPMDLDMSKILDAVSPLSTFAIPNLPAVVKNAQKQTALDGIKAVSDVVFEHRTTVNRDEKLKRAHASEMLSAVPPETGDGKDWVSVAADITEELERLQCEEQAKVREEDQWLAENRKKASDITVAEKAAIDRKTDEEIRLLELKRVAAKELLSNDMAAKLGAISNESNSRLKSIANEYRPKRELLTAERAEAATHAEDVTRISQVKRIAAQASGESDALKAKAKVLTTALSALDDVRSSLLDNLPIKGLTVEGGVIYMDGVPLSEKNTAERALFWLRLAVMRAGELGIICFDGAECLDDKTFALAVDGMKKSGVQWFVGRVTSGDFNVETFDAE